MHRKSAFMVARKLGQRIFTTREISMVSGKSLSAATQALNNLERDGFVIKIFRGVWALEGDKAISPYEVITHLFPEHRAYVSFISALHLHGIIGQIPQVTTLAATSHARKINTKIGAFHAYHITPSFFAGFGWYKGNGSLPVRARSPARELGQGFLIAEPEKALVDCLYLSAHKGNRFGHFPELDFPASFSFKRAAAWTDKIQSRTTRAYVRKMLDAIHAAPRL